jgi:succinate dehydrogenase / fumarate reductase flavoprotein subunit
MVCDEGRGVGPGGLGVYLDFSDAIRRLGAQTIRERYGNLFQMYQRITDENPYQVPMRIYPAVHYTMGGLWVDYNLMSTIPGLHVIGEANFSDHGANRLGASALMQGLADGYFIVSNTIADYLAGAKLAKVDESHPEVRAAREAVEAQTRRFLGISGKRTVDSFHRELGRLLWDKCGMARNATGLKEAIARIPQIREESCGGHFRVEHQTADGEALRDDEHFAYVAAWEYAGSGKAPILNKEPLDFESVKLSTRSYK